MPKTAGIRTQGELARAAGVSRYTVNRALRGLDEVSEETRQRILRIATEHGYRINSAASAMVRKRFNCAAIIQSTVEYRSSLFSGLLFDGVHDALAKHNIHVVVTKMPDAQLLAEGEMPKVLRELMCDGVLMNYFAQIPAPLDRIIRQTRIPAIWMNTRRRKNCVYLDDVEGGRRATEHLLEAGHTRIAYLDYENSVTDPIHHSIDDRYAGYVTAMDAAGLKPWRLRSTDQSMSREERSSFSAEWIRWEDRPTAALCYSRKAAVPVLMAALEAGVRVPEDLSIVTFDQNPWTEGGQHLTTFTHDWQRLGQVAAEELHELIEAGAPASSRPPVRLRFGFDPGTTTAPPREKA